MQKTIRWKRCMVCGCEYQTGFPHKSHWCSMNCRCKTFSGKSANWQHQRRRCGNCGTTFEAPMASPAFLCSVECYDQCLTTSTPSYALS